MKIHSGPGCDSVVKLCMSETGFICNTENIKKKKYFLCVLYLFLGYMYTSSAQVHLALCSSIISGSTWEEPYGVSGMEAGELCANKGPN